MKKALLSLFLFIPVAIYATNYYVAPTGNDNNPGTVTQPFASWQYAFNKLSAGDILYVRGGKYTAMGSSLTGASISSKNGTSGNRITVTAYQNETPVLDCSALSGGHRYGIDIENSSYLYIKGLTIVNVIDGGSGGDPFAIGNCSQITIEQCVVHNSGQGFTLGGKNDYIAYVNCDAYENWDIKNGGDLCNGFNTNIYPGTHVSYYGCRAWKNSDDGFDAYGGDGYITYNKCWAFENGPWHGGDEGGNGSGIKTGSPYGSVETGVQRRIANCLVFDNLAYGFDKSQDGRAGIVHNIFNNVSFRNGCAFNFWDKGEASIIKNNISYLDDRINSDPSWGPSILSNNSWNGFSVSAADFQSLDASQAKGARQSDGSLPVMSFLHLASSSVLIDAGTNVGLPFSGKSPDLGAFEGQTGSTPPVAIPVFISAVIENATPSLLAITFDLSLNNLIVPAASSFNVQVNSIARSVNSVAISGNKVQLTLASAIKFGDIVTVTYTKPANNPLQIASGAQAEGISSQLIVNKLINTVTDPATAKIKMTIYPNPVHHIINMSFEYTGTFSATDAARSPQLIRISDISGKLFIEKQVQTGVVKIHFPINLRPGIYVVITLSGGLPMASQKIIVY